MFRVAPLTALALLVAAPAADASPTRPYPTVDANGDPLVVTTGGVPGPYSWKQCTPGPVCVTLSDAQGEVRPGPTAPGTYFEQYTSLGPDPIYRSPVWQGPRVDLAPPVPTGPMVVGSTVGLQPGRWSGGWSDVTVETLALCATPAGAGCDDFPVGAPLAPEHVGRFLVAHRRHGGLVGSVGGPFDVGPGTALTQSASGPVTSAPVRVPDPSPPTVTLRERALRAKGTLSLGRVTCFAHACKVAVKVSGGGRKAVTTTFVAKQGVTAIKTPTRRGKLTVRVHVDGKLLANGTVTAR